ncbi:MAG: DUF86 domain-containing protein, partial [Candidatus Nanoarchaeia archaeon]
QHSAHHSYIHENVDKKSFLANKEKQNAVIRSLEVIGEASKNIPKSMAEKYPKIPWKEIIGTRDKITHHYFGVDLELIWKVVQENVPELKREILILKKFELKNTRLKTRSQKSSRQ